MSVATIFVAPPEVQAVFDALRAMIAAHPELTSVNSYANIDSSGNNIGITITDNYGNQATFTQRTQTGRVFLEPMSASLAAGGTVTFVATTLDATGSPVPATVTWSMQAGALGTIVGGLYTAPATITAAAVDYVTAMDASGNSATVTVQLHL